MRRGPWIPLAAILSLVAALAGRAVAGQAPKAYSADAWRRPLTEEQKRACAALDDPAVRGLMESAGELRLLVHCGRTAELGLVSAEPDLPGPDAPAASDVQVNESSGESGSSQTQSETSIAVNENTGTICSAWNDSWGYYHGAGITGFGSSTNGGASFADHGGMPSSYGDPALVWRRLDGKFYIASLYASGSLAVWRSDDGCSTFTFLGASSTGYIDDKELIAVDNNPTSPHYGRIYQVWTDFGVGGRIVQNHSDDGVNWSATVSLSPTVGNVQGAWPAVAPDGTLYVAWIRWDPYYTGPITVEGARSVDGGATFTPITSPMSGKVDPYASTPTSGCGRPALNGSVRYLPSPQIAVSANGDLHVVYSYDPDGFNTGDVVNVYYRRSADHGATWLPEVRLNDDAGTNDQFVPTLSVGAGRVVTAWYDRRNDPGNLLFEYYERVSTDGGATFQPSTKLSDVASPVYLDPGLATCYHGDYDTQTQDANSVYVQWSDDRNVHGGHNDPDVFFESTVLGPAGRIQLDRAAYGCGGTVQVTVSDSNVGASTVTAQLSSGAEPVPETLVLTESPVGSGRFVGTLPLTTLPPVSGDGHLSVAGGTTITAVYIDANDGQGGTNVPRQTTAAVDCVAPQIYGVTVSGVTDTTADIRWTTNEPGDSHVTWGTTKPPQTETVLGTSVTAHTLTLGGLASCTNYYFSVGTADAAGNLTTDTAGGAYYVLQTLPSQGTACHRGVVTLDRNLYGCGDFVSITVADIDLNRNPSASETATVTVTSTSATVPEAVTLTETSVDSGIFTGTIPTGPLPVIAGNGVVEGKDSDVVTATYHDADNGLGTAAVTDADASVDCAPPLISNIVLTQVWEDTAYIEWTTSEEAYGTVEFGQTTALGQVAYEDYGDPFYHSTYLYPLSECDRTYFRIVATDDYGSTAIADNGGTDYQFNAWRIPAIYQQDFEGTHNWTLQGDWQVDTPRGLGTDQPDPAAAEHGVKVLGEDLTGLGAHPGDYEPGTPTRYATSPVIVTPPMQNAVLHFHMWLNTDPGAAATIDVHNDTWTNVFTTAGYGWQDSAWETVDIGIGDNADGSDNFQIRFGQSGGTSGTAAESGWNIDRIELRNASITTPVACGGCAGVPSFAGLASATDGNGCAASGILLSWEAAVGWGTGSTGTYSVYRSTSATFVPLASNRIATGLTTTTYTDLTAATNSTYYYIVRAETDETCGGGPHNGGVTDTNVVRRSARDDTSQPAPGSVGDTVLLSLINSANVRLTWGAATGAARYHVLRSGSAQGPFTMVGDVSGLVFDDLDRGTVTSPDFYLVKAVDSCGKEGP